ncbi:MAG: ferrochelatase [Acidibacillus sp.]|nr:ferrochelatase [Acidibacillus sp.]
MDKHIAVLLMAYGTPANLDEVESFYIHIRRGRKPTKEQLDELIGRYEAIGGCSPLIEITHQEAHLLEDALNKHNTGNVHFTVYIGMKHCAPFIEDAVSQFVKDGADAAVGIVLAPHFSSMSVGVYEREANEAALAQNFSDLSFVESWHLEPSLLDALEERLRHEMEKFSDAEKEHLKLVFSAHSLPRRILDQGDPYPEQLLETSRALALRIGFSDWQFAWQSAGRTEEPWLGPDILTVIDDLAEAGYTAVLDCPVGFVSDHLEVLYDLDIEVQKRARVKQIHFERTASLNADPRLIDALKQSITAVCKEKGLL